MAWDATFWYKIYLFLCAVHYGKESFSLHAPPPPMNESLGTKKNYESFTFTLTHLFRCHPYMGNSRCVLLPIMQLNVVSIVKSSAFCCKLCCCSAAERSRRIAGFVIMEIERQTIRKDIQECCHQTVDHRQCDFVCDQKRSCIGKLSHCVMSGLALP